MSAMRLRRFIRDDRGSVALLFAMALLPLLGFVGAAIDYGRAAGSREKVQSALDMTVLAVNRQIGTMNKGQLRKFAQSTLEANLASTNVRIDRISIDEANRSVEMTASLGVETAFLKLLSIDTIDVAAEAQAVTGSATFEIALVLDNSGSMTGARISTLRNAARDLVQTLFGTDQTSDTFRVSLVPFSGAVNVGVANKAAWWIDAAGDSSIAKGLFETKVNRFDLYDEVTNVDWAGCVEVRPAPYHTTDEPPSLAKPDTLFVPTFAPDEPDKVSSGSGSYVNNYLADDGGDCSGSMSGMTDRQKTGRICKYTSEKADTTEIVGTPRGPNLNCDATAITPLTSVRTEIDGAIGKMQAQGFTNILEGLMWGWRTLSPAEPFTSGRAYDEPNNSKFVILMSDGANTVTPNYGNLGSSYTAFGHAILDRLGTDHSFTGMVKKMNDYTLEACTNVKQAGIKVFTIAFDIDDADTVELLAKCASGERYAFDTETTNELSDAFATIAASLGELRIAR